MLYGFSVTTIHDCFGCQANHVELLSDVVKECFISMYANRDCLDKFHANTLNNIKIHYTIIDDFKVIDKDGVEHDIPCIPEMGDLRIENVLPFSSTFTN